MNYKKIILVIALIFLSLDLFIITNDVTFAKQKQKPGQWVTYSCVSGTLVNWWCDPSDNIECLTGQTGKGFCP